MIGQEALILLAGPLSLLPAGAARTQLGPAAAPDLILQGEPQVILGLFSGQLTASQAADRGLEISGDAAVLHRVLPEPAAASYRD